MNTRNVIKNCLLGTMYSDALKPVYAANHRTIPVRIMMLLDKAIKRFGFRVAVHQEAPADDGTHWPAVALTMVGRKRLENIEELCGIVEREKIPGAWVECGVWRGGASIMARHSLSESRQVILCDSFSGLPYDSDEPEWSGHEYLRVSQEEVWRNFVALDALYNVRFVRGWFNDTLPELRVPIAILRADGDMESSTLGILNNLYKWVSIGGFVIIDDYNLAPCRRAVEAFRKLHRIEDPLIDIDGKGVYWRKTERGINAVDSSADPVR